MKPREVEKMDKEGQKYYVDGLSKYKVLTAG